MRWILTKVPFDVEISERAANVQQFHRKAAWWGRLGVVAFVLAVMSLGIARRHYGKQRWVWVPLIVLFSFSCNSVQDDSDAYAAIFSPPKIFHIYLDR